MADSWIDWLSGQREYLLPLWPGNETVLDGHGQPIPHITVAAGSALISIIYPHIVSQIGRLGPPGQPAACQIDELDVDGLYVGKSVVHVSSTAWPSDGSAVGITAHEYLQGYPPPAGSSDRKWCRSMGSWEDAVRWRLAESGDGYYDVTIAQKWWAQVATRGFRFPTDDARSWGSTDWIPQSRDIIFAPWSRNSQDDPALMNFVRGLVDQYQALLDASADAIGHMADSSAPMDDVYLSAWWYHLSSIVVQLDVLADVPPRPSTTQVIRDLADDAVTAVADAAGVVIREGAEAAGRAAHDLIGGLTSGLGIQGIAYVIGGVAAFLALRQLKVF